MKNVNKIIVTGSEGFIGSHLVEKLIENGNEVTAIIKYNFNNSIGNLNYLDKKKLDKINFLFCDLTDKESMNSAFKNADMIFNLAALIGIPYSYQAPRSYINTNLLGLLNILELSRENNLKKVIHLSTSEVYGNAQTSKIDENHRLNAQSPYSASKIAADHLALSYFRSFNLPVSIARPFNTFGPRQSLRAIIPTIINQIINQNKQISLGNIYPKRDLTYVEDTVLGIMSVGFSENKKTDGEVFNLGTGYSISIGDLANLIGKIMGQNILIKQENNRKRIKKSEVDNLISDHSKISKNLGWSPKYKNKTGLKEGLIKTIEFYLKNKDSFSSNQYVI